MKIYETEELQVVAIKRWWQANGTATILGIIAGIIFVGGWNLWQTRQQNTYLQASDLYQTLLVSINNNNIRAISNISKKIIDNYGSTAYASYAALLWAKTKVQQNDLKAAKKILVKQMRTTDSDELKNISRLRLARLMQATGDIEQALQLIAETSNSNTTGFDASYNELKGDLYVALDRLYEARTAYESALRTGNNSVLLQFKLNDISIAKFNPNARTK